MPMPKLFFNISFLFLVFMVACNDEGPTNARDSKKVPRIAIAGLGIESSTFSPALTDSAAFHSKYGPEVFKNYRFLATDSSLRKRAEWIPALVGKSLPGGAVTLEAYEALTNRLLDSLKSNLPYDGLYFDIHGAMSVVGLDDPEGDLLKRIRGVVGYNTLISTSMDLHGNVSESLAGNSDLITCYRMAPHEDAMDTKRRAVENLLDRIENDKGKPAFKAWIPVPILLPGEKTSTRIEPGKSIYAEVEPASKRQGVTDAAIWIGYAWADEPRNHAVVMVTGDDKMAVTTAAEQLAKRFWVARKEFVFVAPTLPWKETLDSAVKSLKRPFYISDMGDNPTAGGAGDVTWTLNQLLNDARFKSATGPTVIYASIPGAELVTQAIKAGIGGKVDGYAGAKVDSRFSPPAHIKGTVHSITKGDRDAEVEVVIKSGSLSIIVVQKRKPYHDEIDFTRLGLDPRKADIVVDKIGYLQPELYAMQKGWIMALTPGGVDQAIEQLPYKRIKRPMFPFDKDMADPDLSARLIPLSGQTSK
jgi:microcystin degradation protein MlrC